MSTKSKSSTITASTTTTITTNSTSTKTTIVDSKNHLSRPFMKSNQIFSQIFSSCCFPATEIQILKDKNDSPTESSSLPSDDDRDTISRNCKIAKKEIIPSLKWIIPPSLPEKYWMEPEASSCSWNVRSVSYLQTKTKYSTHENLFRLVAVDLIQLSENHTTPILSGLSKVPHERIQHYLNNCRDCHTHSNVTAEQVERPFLFAVNITVPGKRMYHLVMYYAIHDRRLIQTKDYNDGSVYIHTPTDSQEEPAETKNHPFSPSFLRKSFRNALSKRKDLNIQQNETMGIMNSEKSLLTKEQLAFQRIASKFFFGSSDEYRNETFKLIPRIVSGNVLVKKAVGSKPTLLGKKVKQYYIQSKDYFELIVDVGSDAIAKKVVGLCTGYAKSLVVDMGFVLEGKSEDELPEVVMGSVRLKNIDFKDARSLCDGN